MTEQRIIASHLSRIFEGLDFQQLIDEIEMDPQASKYHDEMPALRRFLTWAMQAERIRYLSKMNNGGRSDSGSRQIER